MRINDTIEDLELNDEGDVLAAKFYFLEELDHGPFAPALAGEGLDRFHIRERLGDFVREHLAGQVTLIGNQALSPVGRPALALTARMNDPDYWRSYRLSSLFRVWEEAASRLDMSALNRSVDVANSVNEENFSRQFPIGARLSGIITRFSYRGAGLIVDVAGCNHPCLLPNANVLPEFRGREQSLIGRTGDFEIVSVLPTARSVLLKMLRVGDLANQTTVGAVPSKISVADDSGKIERKAALAKILFDAKALRDKLWLSDTAFESIQRILLDAI